LTLVGGYSIMTFREWLKITWEEHRMEVESYEGKPPNYDMCDYFNKYKWWLKRLYKSEVKKEDK